MDDLLGESYACMEQGLAYDEERQFGLAVEMYVRALELLEEAEHFEGVKENELYVNLSAAKPATLLRLDELRSEGGVVEDGKDRKKRALDANDTNGGGKMEGIDAEAQLVACIPDGVQLVTINNESGDAPSYPSPLYLFKFPPRDSSPSSSNSNFDEIRPDAFIQVGPWTYPLYKGQTPIVINEYGAYVVPNPTAEDPNMTVGIILPANAEKGAVEELRKALEELAVVREMTNASEGLSGEEKRRLSDRMAQFLITSGEKVALHLHNTSKKASVLVHQRSAKYRNGIPTETPMAVSGGVKSGVVYVHKGSKVIAKCTRKMLDTIGSIGVAVGRRVAAGTHRVVGDGAVGGMVSGTMRVVGGGITGVSTVWVALEDASKSLCRNISSDTVEIVRVRYGEDAASTTHHALHGAGHTTLAAAQLWDLGPRSIASRMARKAGVQMVRDMDKRGIYTAPPTTHKDK